ncbi:MULTISPECIES: NAD(P)-dependent oxidoreductase [unclassified Sphingomonas]|uniref:NAD(P)-dependent oxidoreductase n=1 Tax=unclassified Sphingomonas TaxID=196159 RepID=UPI0006F4C17C|nr:MULTISPECIES: NAD(P)-dependent oxidoreductase [unclassified Sphingomonas]KRB78772.1 6-phosphogluconate dehydrogenase [Sphingomonas sp. Root710]KRB93681.1 6-phosphogluconate dehydrogenase [Sphingomonas sp. Root720]
MRERIAIIGFGEAGAAFAPGLASRTTLSVYDCKTDDPVTAPGKRADLAAAGVSGADSAATALADAVGVLSLVTADQALAAATVDAPLLPRGAIWFDMNSVAPQTKRDAAAAVEAAGGRYVDVAVMAPVHPSRTGVPLLVSGPHAEEGAALLGHIGFADARVVPGDVGRASSIKMLRSVMVKGIEALTAECLLAADRAGVLDEVLASLDASPPPPAWTARADYNIERMMVHGLRRAAEMDEVVKTLDALGTGTALSRATAARHGAIGALGLLAPREGLAAKLAQLSLEDAA